MTDYYFYMLMNKANTVIYVGVTNNLLRRINEHREHKIKGFTDKYNVTKLVYFEYGSEVMGAIDREKQVKKWNREKKIELIKTINPNFDDLYDQINAV